MEMIGNSMREYGNDRQLYEKLDGKNQTWKDKQMSGWEKSNNYWHQYEHGKGILDLIVTNINFFEL